MCRDVVSEFGLNPPRVHGERLRWVSRCERRVVDDHAVERERRRNAFDLKFG